MPRTITISDLPAPGPELSDEELAGIAGGMRPNGTHSTRSWDPDTGTEITDHDF
jgi:putative ATP-grasp target RiPP